MENKKSTPAPKRRSVGRPRSIDRSALLDAAEDIVARDGAAALTIDALARAVGVTKGGVQYAFGTKEALIRAMIDRWEEGYAASVRALVGDDPTPVAAIRAHVETTRDTPAADHARSAAILSSLLRSPEAMETTRRWYRERLSGLDMADPAHRTARLAFLATEGAYLLRFFGLIDMDDASWNAIFKDIGTLRPDMAGGDGTAPIGGAKKA